MMSLLAVHNASHHPHSPYCTGKYPYHTVAHSHKGRGSPHFGHNSCTANTLNCSSKFHQDTGCRSSYHTVAHSHTAIDSPCSCYNSCTANTLSCSNRCHWGSDDKSPHPPHSPRCTGRHPYRTWAHSRRATGSPRPCYSCGTANTLSCYRTYHWGSDCK